MAEWWYVVLVVVLALAAILYLRGRQNRDLGRPGGERNDSAADRNFRTERDDARSAGMSAEDREWEAASLRRNQESQERKQQVAEDRPTSGSNAGDRGPTV